MKETVATGIIDKAAGKEVVKADFSRCPLCGRLRQTVDTASITGLAHTLFVEKKCPDCGKFDFLEGPHGGLAVNIKCANCGSEFNVCPPWFAERIGEKA